MDISSKKLLHVGCGLNSKRNTSSFFNSDTWQETRLDINPKVQPDIVGNLTKMTAVGDGEFDAIWSAHNIEHLYAHEVDQAIREFARVLHQDGAAVIKCPDLLSVAQKIGTIGLHGVLYHSPAGPITPHDVLFGLGRAVEQGNVYMAHKTGFTIISLARHLLRAGFGTVCGLSIESTFEIWIVGFKGVIDQAEASLRFLRYTDAQRDPIFLGAANVDIAQRNMAFGV